MIHIRGVAFNISPSTVTVITWSEDRQTWTEEMVWRYATQGATVFLSEERKTLTSQAANLKWVLRTLKPSKKRRWM